MAAQPNHPAWTWGGILGHLSGLPTVNHSGYNGLAVHQLVSGNPIELFNFTAGVSVRQRQYGGRHLAPSRSYSVGYKGFAAGMGAVSFSVNEGLSEAAVTGRITLGKWKDLFRGAGSFLTQRLPNAAGLGGAFDRLNAWLPEVSVSGEMAFYLGRTDAGVWYIRFQTAGQISFKLGDGYLNRVLGTRPRNAPGVLGGGRAAAGLTGFSGGGGRSWQIQLFHLSAHLPPLWKWF